MILSRHRVAPRRLPSRHGRSEIIGCDATLSHREPCCTARRNVGFGPKADISKLIVASLVWGRPGPTKKDRQDCVKHDGGPKKHPHKLARESDVTQIQRYMPSSAPPLRADIRLHSNYVR